MAVGLQELQQLAELLGRIDREPLTDEAAADPVLIGEVLDKLAAPMVEQLLADPELVG